MPDETPKQTRSLRVASAGKRGEPRDVSPDARKAARSMSEKTVREFTRDGGRTKARKSRR